MTTDETLTLLAGANPVREADLPAPGTAEAQALRERIVRAPAERPFSRGVRLGWVAAGLAAVALAAVVTLPRALPGDELGPSPAAAAVLERAAVAATAYSREREGRYAYSKAETLYSATTADNPPYTLLFREVRETWVAADGSGRMRTVRVRDPIFPGPRDRERWLASGGWRPPGGTREQPLRMHPRDAAELAQRPPADLDRQELDRLMNAPAHLPIDPDRLEPFVRAYAEMLAGTDTQTVEGAMFNQLADLLEEVQGSAELRAATYRVLARLDGIELVGPARDPAGRPGTAIDAPVGSADDLRRRVVIDPATGNLLAQQTVVVRRVPWLDAEPGGVVSQVVYLETGWVDGLRERPSKSR